MGLFDRIFRRSLLNHDLAEELQEHIEERTEQIMRRGFKVVDSDFDVLKPTIRSTLYPSSNEISRPLRSPGATTIVFISQGASSTV
jgi:hypothetical protein